MGGHDGDCARGYCLAPAGVIFLFIPCYRCILLLAYLLLLCLPLRFLSSPFVGSFLLHILFHFSFFFISFPFVFHSLFVYRGSWRVYVGSVIGQHNGIALYNCCLPSEHTRIHPPLEAMREALHQTTNERTRTK